MTDKEILAGDNAAHQFLANLIGWKEMFVKRYEEAGVRLVIGTADSTEGDVPAKEQAAGSALYKSISDAGYGNQVTQTQCGALAVAVYQAVLRERHV